MDFYMTKWKEYQHLLETGSWPNSEVPQWAKEIMHKHACHASARPVLEAAAADHIELMQDVLEEVSKIADKAAIHLSHLQYAEAEIVLANMHDKLSELEE